MLQISRLDNKTTADNAPDPDLSAIEIKGWNILVRPVHVEATTKGGIIIADQTRDAAEYLMNVCKVLQIGSLAFTQEGFNGERWCEVGDYVMIPKLSGTKLCYKGIPLTLVACDRVLAIVKDPKDIDPNFNLTTYST